MACEHQKYPPRGVLQKRWYEKFRKIYRKTPVPEAATRGVLLKEGCSEKFRKIRRKTLVSESLF